MKLATGLLLRALCSELKLISQDGRLHTPEQHQSVALAQSSAIKIHFI